MRAPSKLPALTLEEVSAALEGIEFTVTGFGIALRFVCVEMHEAENGDLRQMTLTARSTGAPYRVAVRSARKPRSVDHD